MSITILQIFQELMVLGYEKECYLGLTNRAYPQTKTVSTSSIVSNILSDFSTTILNMLSRDDDFVLLKKVCLDFFCTCLKGTRFADYIRAKISLFR